MVEPDKLVLIDGHALVYRAYFALPPTMRTAQGELTNAVFGFASMLLRVLSQSKKMKSKPGQSGSNKRVLKVVVLVTVTL